MNRRELIKQVALITGATVVGSEFFLSGCKNNDKVSLGLFNDEEIKFFDELAETIIPKTDTPGAKDAGVGSFMASYSTDCYDELQQRILKDGIKSLHEAAERRFRRDFMKMAAADRQKLLIEIDAEAKKYNETRKEQPPHYFTLMKQMTLLGFFTSKPGATQVLRYVPVPGKYQGCIDYKEGETSWV